MKFLLLAATCYVLARAQAPEGLEFFETRIRPVLAKNCYLCHSHEGKVARGGLVLDSKAGAVAGGDSGPAIVPGDTKASLLIQGVRQTGRLQMPPGGKLAGHG